MGKTLGRQVKGKDSSGIIPAIKQGDTLVTSATDINKTFQQYYEKLYHQHQQYLVVMTGGCKICFNIDMPKLDTDQARKFESPITEGEIKKAVSLMNTGKSSSNDGFPAE